MIQVRRGIFESNSSSTHSIAIPKKSDYFAYISFNFGEFGWNFYQEDPADYFYTALYETSETRDDAMRKVARFKEILDSHNIEYKMEEPVFSKFGHCVDAYIDHGDQLDEFVNDLLSDEDKLLRFLSNGLVFTGNDNDDDYGFLRREDQFCDGAVNPYYMSNSSEYEWYYKGN